MKFPPVDVRWDLPLRRTECDLCSIPVKCTASTLTTTPGRWCFRWKGSNSSLPQIYLLLLCLRPLWKNCGVSALCTHVTIVGFDNATYLLSWCLFCHGKIKVNALVPLIWFHWYFPSLLWTVLCYWAKSVTFRHEIPTESNKAAGDWGNPNLQTWEIGRPVVPGLCCIHLFKEF